MTVNNTVKMARPILNKRPGVEAESPIGISMCECPRWPFPPDHQLSPDFSMYASSPNSLYMYELERNDMQNSFNQRCSTTSYSSMSEASDTMQMDEMDMEYSRLPEAFQSAFGPKSTGLSLEGTPCSESLWDMTGSPVSVKMEDVFQCEPLSSEEPTLAALNCDDSIFEDIESVIRDDLASAESCLADGSLTPAVSCGQLTSSYTQSSVPRTSANPFMNARQSSSRQTSSVAQVNSKPTATISSREFAPENQRDDKEALHRGLGLNTLSTSQAVGKPGTQSKSPVEQGVTSGKSGLKRQLKVDDRKWEEVERFLHEDVPATKVIKTETSLQSPSSSCGGCVTSTSTVKDEIDSQDEGFDSDNGDSDADNGQDWMSESETDDSFDQDFKHSERRSLMRSKEPQYFWQYNAQSKGPKQSRLVIPVSSSDPHVLHDFEDPVFDPGHKDTAIRHGGKARRGDGNDISPNPKKLYQIGLELKKLSDIISDLSPGGNVPISIRNRSKREKNKLASRACRLKKKAQHEANKVKLHGLEQEHHQLMNVLQSIREEIAERMRNPDVKGRMKLTEKLDELYKENLSSMIAGHVTEYVNSVIEKVIAGDASGGLDL